MRSAPICGAPFVVAVGVAVRLQRFSGGVRPGIRNCYGSPKQRRAPPESLNRSIARAGARLLKKKAGEPMFLILAIVLVVMWLGGFVMFKSAGMLIHLLLLFAVISLVLHFITGNRSSTV
jgi:Family of unknown function (DUF5670)